MLFAFHGWVTSRRIALKYDGTSSAQHEKARHHGRTTFQTRIWPLNQQGQASARGQFDVALT